MRLTDLIDDMSNTSERLSHRSTHFPPEQIWSMTKRTMKRPFLNDFLLASPNDQPLPPVDEAALIILRMAELVHCHSPLRIIASDFGSAYPPIHRDAVAGEAIYCENLRNWSGKDSDPAIAGPEWFVAYYRRDASLAAAEIGSVVARLLPHTALLCLLAGAETEMSHLASLTPHVATSRRVLHLGHGHHLDCLYMSRAF